MTIILPTGCVDDWQDAIREDSHPQWDELAGDLLRAAADQADRTVRDDLLTLALLACIRAFEVLDRVEAMQGRFELEAA